MNDIKYCHPDLKVQSLNKGAINRLMHLSVWTLPPPPGWPKEFWQKNGLFVRIATLPLAFTVRTPPKKKIYISTICNIKMMSERSAVIRVSCIVERFPVICLPQFTLTCAQMLTHSQQINKTGMVGWMCRFSSANILCSKINLKNFYAMTFSWGIEIC